MVALGAQDDFAFAQEFVATANLTESEVTFLWDRTFSTWQAFDIRRNSSMLLLSPDLSTSTDSFVGFDEGQQQQVLDSLSQFVPPA